MNQPKKKIVLQYFSGQNFYFILKRFQDVEEKHLSQLKEFVESYCRSWRNQYAVLGQVKIFLAKVFDSEMIWSYGHGLFKTVWLVLCFGVLYANML